MKVFVYDDLDCYPIPSFLIEVSPYDLYKNWSAYQLMIKADFELLFNKIQCYHGTKADPISIQRDGLKILTLDKLEKMIIDQVRNQGATDDEINQALNRPGYQMYKDIRSKNGMHSLCLHTSRKFALTDGCEFFKGSEFNRRFLDGLPRYKVLGIPLLIHCDIALEALEQDIWDRESVVADYIFRALHYMNGELNISGSSETTINFYKNGIPFEAVSEIEVINPCTP